jgi:Tol biopolymer transport system component
MLRTTFTVSTGGVLLYEPGATTDSGGGTDLVWLDRTGKGGVGERAEYEGMRLSPDGKRLAVAVSVASPNPDIWVLDPVRGSKARLTFDPASHHLPSWSPDGQRVAFISQTGSSYVSSLHARLANGGGQDELLLASEDAATALLWPQWSPDGRYLVYQKESGSTGASVWAVPTSGDHKTFSIIKPESPQATIVNDRLSPDGQRFLFAVPPEIPSSPMVLVLNWDMELKR